MKERNRFKCDVCFINKHNLKQHTESVNEENKPFPKTIICKDIFYQFMMERNPLNVKFALLALPENQI